MFRTNRRLFSETANIYAFKSPGCSIALVDLTFRAFKCIIKSSKAHSVTSSESQYVGDLANLLRRRLMFSVVAKL